MKLRFAITDTEIGISDKNNQLTSFSKIVLDLMEASGLDKQTCETLVNDFFKQSLRIIDNAKNQMLKNQLLEVGILLHRLKGSAGNVRAKEIVRLAIEADEAMKTINFDKLSSLLCDIEKLLEELMITKGAEELTNDK